MLLESKKVIEVLCKKYKEDIGDVDKLSNIKELKKLRLKLEEWKQIEIDLLKEGYEQGFINRVYIGTDTYMEFARLMLIKKKLETIKIMKDSR